MNNSLRIFSVFLLATLYYFGVYGAIPSPENPEKNRQEKTDETAHFYAASSHLSFHTVNSDLSISSCSNPGFLSSLKYSANDLSLTAIAGKLLDTRFAQYARFFEDFLILKRKTEIIFPSHYFW